MAKFATAVTFRALHEVTRSSATALAIDLVLEEGTFVWKGPLWL